MRLYADTELDGDIKYVKEVFTRYSSTYKDIGSNFTKLNETVAGRIGFISSQFKCMFGSNL